jgi:RNA polymerase sigma factor (sigma-70 family)
MRKQKFTDQEYIKGFRKNNSEVVNHFYREISYLVFKHVLKRIGNKHDAQDVLQEVVLNLSANFSKKEFVLKGQLWKYSMTICKNIWTRLFEKRKLTKNAESEASKLRIEQNQEDEYVVRKMQLNIYYRYLELLSPTCQQVIEMYNAKVSYYEIAKKLNLLNEANARKKKSNCVKKLTQLVEGHNDDRYFN